MADSDEPGTISVNKARTSAKKTITNQPLSCRYCSKKYSRSGNRNQHEYIAHLGWRYRCIGCNKDSCTPPPDSHRRTCPQTYLKLSEKGKFYVYVRISKLADGAQRKSPSTTDETRLVCKVCSRKLPCQTSDDVNNILEAHLKRSPRCGSISVVIEKLTTEPYSNEKCTNLQKRKAVEPMDLPTFPVVNEPDLSRAFSSTATTTGLGRAQEKLIYPRGTSGIDLKFPCAYCGRPFENCQEWKSHEKLHLTVGF